MAEETLALRLRVHGKVQGVWYRAWSVEQARELGLDGWVRNRSDGTVEAAVSGPDVSVREMVRRCRRGPRAAQVTMVVETPEAEALAPGFRQLPTI